MDFEMEIFDEETSKQIEAEHIKDMDDAVRTIGARGMVGMGLGAGSSALVADEEKPQQPASKGLMGKLSSVFSRKAAISTTSESTPSTSTKGAIGELPTPPAGTPEKGQETQAIATSTSSGAVGKKLNLPCVPTCTPPLATTAGTEVEAEEALKRRLQSAYQTTPAAPAVTPPTEVPPTETAKGNSSPAAATTAVAPTTPGSATSGTVTSTALPSTNGEAQAVAPELKVLPFEVREPSLGAAIVGQLVVLKESCYVWAATEGTATQGSLSVAIGTRFDSGLPTVTSLLAGVMDQGLGAGVAGQCGGGLSASMAQRLCKRTGRVVFVSCDLSEDSQVLIAAVEAKVVKFLKQEEAAAGPEVA